MSGEVNLEDIKIIVSFFNQLRKETLKGGTGDNARILMKLTGPLGLDLNENFAKSIISGILSKCQEIIKSGGGDSSEFTQKYTEVSDLARELGIANMGKFLETLRTIPRFNLKRVPTAMSNKDKLISMGFSTESVDIALRKSGDNFEMAFENLLTESSQTGHELEPEPEHEAGEIEGGHEGDRLLAMALRNVEVKEAEEEKKKQEQVEGDWLLAMKLSEHFGSAQLKPKKTKRRKKHLKKKSSKKHKIATRKHKKSSKKKRTGRS